MCERQGVSLSGSMKLSAKEKKVLEKANSNLRNAVPSRASEIARAERWSRSNVHRNRKAYTRKQKHKAEY